MRKIYFFMISLIVFQFTYAYVGIGSDSTLDILTWNIENYPKAGTTTVSEVRTIVNDLGVDLIAVQEIASETDFNSLLAGLNGWEGLLSPHVYSSGDYQKVGILYNRNKISINSWQLLFENDYNFPRPPLLVNLNYSEGTHHTSLNVIVLHLKAMGDSQSEERRRQAIIRLKSYMDAHMGAGDSNFVMLGDMNDRLEDATPTPNVFTVLLNDADHYQFLTEAIAGTEGSYINWSTPNLIDHIMITTDLSDEFGHSGKTHVQYLDSQNANYESTVSDHRPVLAQFLFDGSVVVPPDTITPIAEIQSRFGELNGSTVTIRGIITLGAGIVATNYTSAYIQDNSGAGINVYIADSVYHALESGMDVTIKGQLTDYNGLHEILPVNVTLHQSGNQLPVAISVNTSELSSTIDQGLWIQVKGHVVSISGTFSQTIMLDDGSGSGKVYIDSDTGIDISPISVGDSLHVYGVKTVYKAEGELLVGYPEHIQKIDPSGLDFTESTKAHELRLLGNYPNPFNPQTVIRFDAAAHRTATLNIYNMQGQLIIQHTWLLNGTGIHEIAWDGKNGANQIVPSGVYVYTLSVGSSRKSGKMLLVR